jgi:hypothetical protein
MKMSVTGLIGVIGGYIGGNKTWINQNVVVK